MDQKSFGYTLSHKNKMLVVTFTGELSSVVLPGLEACRSEIQSKEDVRCVVFYFQQVGFVSPEAIPVLAQMQREIRSRGLELRLCSLKESIKDKLVRMGVVRGMEVTEDLRAALISFGKVA
ncbi:STAS domain-containing protein [Bdellovibrio svalbardensis]|uniref:STAS domain-containing protein n=1 Tax=Bdellovibrio svalbardensis TaxID=2972972 RepID=A0ABT6DNC7_9BACT|nr:STAS domain-containing protein [Bdellovibrio svalbardensis]MDG0817610.1 STAS domain-containing protein [Bdellovibrio svalbardensis]